MLLRGARHRVVVLREPYRRPQRVDGAAVAACGRHGHGRSAKNAARLVDVSLERGPGREVPRPCAVGVVAVREKVVRLHRPGVPRGVDGLSVRGGGGVEHVHAGLVGAQVHVVDELLEVLVPLPCAAVLEVGPHLPHDVAGWLGVVGHLPCARQGQVHVVLNVDVLQALVILDLAVLAVDVEAQPLGRAVVATQEGPSEDLGGRADALGGAPHHLHSRLVRAQLPVLEIDAPEVERIEPGLSGEKPCLRRAMPERVNLPPHPGLHVELVQEELVSVVRVVDHGGPMGRRFVVHAPAAVGKLNLSVLDILSPLGLGVRVLLAPPALEEALLDVEEAAVRVLGELVRHCVQDVLHARKLDGVVVAGQVLLVGLQPRDVVVSVRHQMNVQHAVPRLRGGLVPPGRCGRRREHA
mmetsp:Transcript_3649/g.15210  ORF Transcript_3649/g.15210 Transcript_3649/m.15210 type:complete len:410 (-) Transcript_3649:67-1296(-)